MILLLGRNTAEHSTIHHNTRNQPTAGCWGPLIHIFTHPSRHTNTQSIRPPPPQKKTHQKIKTKHEIQSGQKLQWYRLHMRAKKILLSTILVVMQVM